MDIGSLKTITYEVVDGNIARITLDRPEVRNAQSRRLIYELNDALTAAAFDDDIKVVILAGNGPHFSSGHDQRDVEAFQATPVGITGGFAAPGTEGPMAHEEEVFLNMCRRWQQLPKPTIAQVHGKTIAGGLMLAWVCDLIIASDDASFSDITVGMGVNGVEWFAHPWELGIRKAKEMLFTGEPVSAEDAHRLGMVNRVVPRAELPEATLRLARTIAGKSSFGLKLAKLSCNQTLDAQGFWTAQQAAFSLQTLGHANNRLRFGMAGDPSGMRVGRAARSEGSAT
ncbi:enoyl-CoA hydratase/isomerase family protein [Nocardia nova SH22a]|uniref:Enoyl-CoA hydratase/isomerase family protein n=1 Tax=Nocardia nova SH22a TaxID=1415166 RepID=W5THG8_9NOCA|nr:enoyl-CoA hydratase [Nocardia nova]AHH18413.1 enoyl-CoA hydratase/isomerase family protein [Nocardia nova SH22a]